MRSLARPERFSSSASSAGEKPVGAVDRVAHIGHVVTRGGDDDVVIGGALAAHSILFISSVATATIALKIEQRS
jgi:hypothetical protein